MFYQFIKIIAQCVLLFFFRRKIVIGKALQQLSGPAVIAANHPNSMLDAILIACVCRQPVHFMIRSDMFKNPLFKFFLHHLNGIPVYRVTEEKDKLRENFTSFNICRDILKRGGKIIIFSEGVTLHDWKLKPLKSGTAKLVAQALKDPELSENLQVLPVAITYSDYAYKARTVLISAQAVFFPGRCINANGEGQWKQVFNEYLYNQLLPMVPEMDSDQPDKKTSWQICLNNLPVKNTVGWLARLNTLGKKIAGMEEAIPGLERVDRFHYALTCRHYRLQLFALIVLAVPAITGWLLNAPYYYPVTGWCRRKTHNSIFFDALAFGVYIASYPLYVLGITLGVVQLFGWPFMAMLFLLPSTGWICLQAHRWWLSLYNRSRISDPAKNYLAQLEQA